MKKAQIKDYNQLCQAREQGRLLTPEGVAFICRANHYNAEAIGRHFLEVLPTICPDYAQL